MKHQTSHMLVVYTDKNGVTHIIPNRHKRPRHIHPTRSEKKNA